VRVLLKSNQLRGIYLKGIGHGIYRGERKEERGKWIVERD
jgi:hypothetical protein